MIRLHPLNSPSRLLAGEGNRLLHIGRSSAVLVESGFKEHCRIRIDSCIVASSRRL